MGVPVRQYGHDLLLRIVLTIGGEHCCPSCPGEGGGRRGEGRGLRQGGRTIRVIRLEVDLPLTVHLLINWWEIVYL